MTLQGPELLVAHPQPWHARSYAAYADALRAAGRHDEARDWDRRVRAADPLPELPDLAEVWAPPADAAETAVVVERLRAAEHQLTAYRTALFARLDECTAALIARYRSDPSAALRVLERGAV